ncbi:hypothetical protein NDA16_001674 [Ustilago loliicola]|nr:hypothetical protein NDA16_001674 [Ustilago loliicola]
MPPAHRGPTGSPMDRWTDASPSAIASGFQTAMSLGPQPRLDFVPASGLAQSMTSANFGTDDEDDFDDDEDRDDGSPANDTGKKAKGKGAKGKKNASANKGKAAQAAQHRKEQNRAAQREFRQRKQQYIRALEARVELLSSDHDTQVNRLRFALRHLLTENNHLRSIVTSLAHFIGNRSIGGCLVEAGMTREFLEATIKSSSEKVMSEAWANWPGAGECEALKEIRKESNIPPEGLPESKLANYFRDVNNNGGSNSSNTSFGAETAAEGSTGDKRRRTTDDPASKDSKRIRKTDDAQNFNGAGTANTAATSSNQSSPAARPDLSSSNGQSFVSPSQSTPANDPNQAWQQQQQQTHQQQQAPPQQPQQQQQQMAYPLPTQFWQPSPAAFSRQGGNEVDSMFAQTLLGGSYSDFANFTSMFPNDGMNQSSFPSHEAVSFSGLISDGANNAGSSGGLAQPGPPPDMNYLGFGSTPSTFGMPPSSSSYSTSIPPTSNSTSDDKAFPISKTSGVDLPLIAYGAKAPAELFKLHRRRFARVVAQVNRIWAKRGATAFYNTPINYQIDDSDMRYLKEREANDPHIKLAYMRLPNNWDEGDLSPRGQGENSSSGSAFKDIFDLEKKLEALLVIRCRGNTLYINPNHVPPPIFKPTPLQLSTPHDILIEHFPWASIRDKLIQMPNLDMHSLTIDIIRFLSPDGCDVVSERSWILTLPFFIRYPQLADPDLLKNMNRQRASIGEPEVTMDDVWKEHHRFTEYTQAKLKELG